MLAADVCKEDPRGDMTYSEYFVKGTVPKEYCTCHVKVKVCNETGLLANENACTDVTEKVFITRPDVDTNTSWQKAKDAEYTLTIKENCTTHLVPVEPETPENPQNPEETTKPENPDTPDEPENPNENEIGNNVTDGNNTVVDGNNTVVDTGNNVVNNTTTDGNVTDVNNTVTENEVLNDTTE